MTLTVDPNRIHWEAVARDEPTDWAGLATEAEGIEDRLVEDPAGLWSTPDDAATVPVILAVHGGGFVSGSAATHRRGH
jgi:monoterpene epsilon-lactone hydrolase